MIAERLCYLSREKSQMLHKSSSRIGGMLNALSQSFKRPVQACHCWGVDRQV